MHKHSRASTVTLFFVLINVCTNLWSQTHSSGSYPDAFIEEGGMVAFEAINFHENLPGDADHSWVSSNVLDQRGSAAMQALPDIGTQPYADLSGPVLKFHIYFQTSGMYCVYLRAAGPNTSGDSVYLALDGENLFENNFYGINDLSPDWEWRKESGDPLSKVTFEIEEPGFHVFEIWMREDGVIVDDVVISQDMDLTDAALNGTPYSSRYFENPPNAAPIAAADSLVILEGGPAVMFDPLANDQDPDGDPLTLLAASSPEYGMVDLLDGQAVYTLNQNHPVWSTLDKGVMLFDNFDYLVGDGNGGEALGHVSISIVGISSGDISDQLSALGYSGLELTLAYDSELDAAAPGTYTYEVEPRNEDLARARVTLHLSQDLIEAIQTGQDPRFLLDLIGAPEPVENPTPEIPEEEPGFPGDFAFEMTTLETGYRHVKLIWMDNVGWSSPWLIQRSTTSSFVDPVNLVDNQTADNSGEGSFRWLGINADNYVDIDGLEENTTYYYRVATCLNLSDYYQQGANPRFSSWIYGKATTGSLAAAKKQVYNVRNFGAIPGDGQNDYPAVLSALAAAESAGGGVVYLPAGSYDLWPTDSTVKVVGGLPTLQVGKSATSCMFNVKSDNITFLGETNENGPTSYMNFYLWEKIPATKYLSIRDINGTELQVRRYALFQPGNVSEITFKNLNIDMGAVPVNTGKEWYTLEDKKYQWDISHKFFHSNNSIKFKNAVIENVVCRNGRGELIYNGGGSEKILIKDCILGPSNSSTISGSFDAEIVDTVIRDSANASVESAIFSNQVSAIDGKIYNQNHIARGCTFIGLDQSKNGVMKNLPGPKNFIGWACFNQQGTYQSVTDSSFRDCVTTSFAPWYEYRNGFRFNCAFGEIPKTYAGSIIRTWTSAQPSYKLAGGMSNILWLGDTISVTRDWGNHQPFFYSQPGGAAVGNESPWIWEAVRFENSGGPHEISRLWTDVWAHSQGRQEAVFKDWTKSSDLAFDAAKFEFLSTRHIEPAYINFFE